MLREKRQETHWFKDIFKDLFGIYAARSFPKNIRFERVSSSRTFSVCNFSFPFLAPYAPNERFHPMKSLRKIISSETNDIGNDILSELIFGTRISITVGFAAGLNLDRNYFGHLCRLFQGTLELMGFTS